MLQQIISPCPCFKEVSPHHPACFETGKISIFLLHIRLFIRISGWNAMRFVHKLKNGLPKWTNTSKLNVVADLWHLIRFCWNDCTHSWEKNWPNCLCHRVWKIWINHLRLRRRARVIIAPLQHRQTFLSHPAVLTFQWIIRQQHPYCHWIHHPVHPIQTLPTLFNNFSLKNRRRKTFIHTHTHSHTTHIFRSFYRHSTMFNKHRRLIIKIKVSHFCPTSTIGELWSWEVS